MTTRPSGGEGVVNIGGGDVEMYVHGMAAVARGLNGDAADLAETMRTKLAAVDAGNLLLSGAASATLLNEQNVKFVQMANTLEAKIREYATAAETALKKDADIAGKATGAYAKADDAAMQQLLRATPNA